MKINETKASATFKSDIYRAQETVSLAGAMASMASDILVPAVDDMLRYSVVQTIGSIDNYFSNVLFELLNDYALISSASIRSNLNLFTFSIKDLSDLLNEIECDDLGIYSHRRRVLKEKINRTTFQNERRPDHLAKMFGVSNFWPRVSDLHLGYDVQKKYGDIVARRNEIAHACDRSSVGDEVLQPIDQTYVRDAIDVVKVVQSCFDKEVAFPLIERF